MKVVGGWNEYQFEEKRLPTLEEINAAVPDRPVFVLYLYGLGFLNKKGIETLGYTSETTYKDGVVELDANGNPTGRLIAKPNALILYSTLAKTNKLSREDQVNSTLHYYGELNRLGVTIGLAREASSPCAPPTTCLPSVPARNWKTSSAGSA